MSTAPDTSRIVTLHAPLDTPRGDHLASQKRGEPYEGGTVKRVAYISGYEGVRVELAIEYPDKRFDPA